MITCSYQGGTDCVSEHYRLLQHFCVLKLLLNYRFYACPYIQVSWIHGFTYFILLFNKWKHQKFCDEKRYIKTVRYKKQQYGKQKQFACRNTIDYCIFCVLKHLLNYRPYAYISEHTHRKMHHESMMWNNVRHDVKQCETNNVLHDVKQCAT